MQFQSIFGLVALCFAFFNSFAPMSFANEKNPLCERNLIPAQEPDLFVHRLARDPISTYREIEDLKNQSILKGQHTFLFSHARPVLLKIMDDIAHRIETGSVLELPQFKKHYEALNKLQQEGIFLLKNEIPYRDFNQFVIKWVEAMDEVLRSADPALQGTYHREIAGPELKELMKEDHGTYIFFTFEPVDDVYFLDTRSAPIYLHGLIDVPRFEHTAETYTGGPLVSTHHIQLHIDGYKLDLEEFTKHDAGHSAFMRRRDLWIFENSGYSRESLVTDWAKNRFRIKAELKNLEKEDLDLGKAAELLLTEIIHERGYQYFLPFLRQQLNTSKWTEVVRKKAAANYWGKELLTEIQLKRLDEARDRLLEIVNQHVAEDTFGRMQTLQADRNEIILKHWFPIETFKGVPSKVEISNSGQVEVSFEVAPGVIKKTSLYEVSLAQVRVSEGAKTSFPIPAGVMLSKVELFKLLQIETLLSQKQGTEFTITPQPKSFFGQVRRFDISRGLLMFESTGGVPRSFPLHEVSIQPIVKKYHSHKQIK